MKIMATVLTITMIVTLIPITGVRKIAAATNPYSGGYYNCTWAAWQYAYERAGVALPGFTGNAIGWYDGAKAKGYTVSSVPREKSIAVWSGGSGNMGHVAYVDKVSGNRIYVYEGGYGSVGKHEGWVNASGIREYTKQTLKGYIYLGAATSVPTTITVSTDTADGITKSNAVLHGTVKKNSSQKVTSCGIYLGTSSANMTKRNTETVSSAANASNNGTQFNIWYNLNSELGITLNPSTTYYYKIYAVYAGKEYTGAVKSFTTASGVTILDSGTLSTGIKWTYDSTGKLSFSGSGAIPDWKNTGMMPWYKYIKNVNAVDLGGQITSIGNYSFYDFYNIQTVRGGQNVSKIGSCAFTHTSIKEYPFTLKVTSIGGGAFRDCCQIRTADISNATELGGSAFQACSELEDVKLSPNLQSIESLTFSGTSLSRSDLLPNKIKKIGASAFGHTQFSELKLPEGLIEIGEQAFMSAKLKNITIPERVTSIGRMAFCNCTNLESITFNGNAPAIDPLAFYYCGLVANYPIEKSGWDSAINVNYDGEITWKPYGEGVDQSPMYTMKYKGDLDSAFYIGERRNIQFQVLDKGNNTIPLISLSGEVWYGDIDKPISINYKNGSDIVSIEAAQNIKSQIVGPINLLIHAEFVVNGEVKYVDQEYKIYVSTMHTNHNYQFKNIVAEATCINEGIANYECVVCGDIKTVYIDKVSHNFGVNEKQCKVCGILNPNYIISDDKTLTEIQSTNQSTSKPNEITKPKKVSIKAVKVIKKKLTVKWKKLNGVSGYQIQYSTDNKFKNKTKMKTIKGNSKKNPSKAIGKLLGGKKYYVRVRAYKSSGKNKVYGAWSKAKKVQL